MKILYKNVDGSQFEGSLFHPSMKIVSIEGKVYRTVFDAEGTPSYRTELERGEDGLFIWPQEESI